MHRQAIIPLVIVLAGVGAGNGGGPAPAARATPASESSPVDLAAKANAVCRAGLAAAVRFDHSMPEVQSDDDMATWQLGIADIFGATASRLRAARATRLASSFSSVAAAGHGLAVAYDRGNHRVVVLATGKLDRAEAAAVSVSRSMNTAVCTSFLRRF
jgi:hypothetical protein